MSELIGVLLVFWALWAADGVRFAANGLFNLFGLGRRAGVHEMTWHLPHGWPAGWRATCPDIPFSISPAGIANRAVGVAGREGSSVPVARAWRWEEIKETRVEKGWVLVNGGSFYRDTGHITAGGLLSLAQMEPVARTRRIEAWVGRCVRPAHLRRRQRVLQARTGTLAMLNTLFFLLAVALTIYLASDFSAELPKRWSDFIGRTLPLYAGYLLLLHVAAVGFAVRAMKRLKAARPDNRGTALFSAAMLPPQAMRLRAVVGEAWFPLQHPLAYALAFAREKEREAIVFQTLADLRWPLGGEKDSPLAREVTAWFHARLAQHVAVALQIAHVDEQKLFALPRADSEESVSYCPRCRSQFVAGRTQCSSDGVKLVPLKEVE
ncbi:hypothetical protein [Oleiharenicola lentus]|uniref:hypothetical protein n=1 Tax=Oleiharenicola lentus TaxID=2508720 RepID=UPI003F6629E2